MRNTCAYTQNGVHRATRCTSGSSHALSSLGERPRDPVSNHSTIRPALRRPGVSPLTCWNLLPHPVVQSGSVTGEREDGCASLCPSLTGTKAVSRGPWGLAPRFVHLIPFVIPSSGGGSVGIYLWPLPCHPLPPPGTVGFCDKTGVKGHCQGDAQGTTQMASAQLRG